ncbi:MAG TPA: mevalonate kinase [Candidatus Poseidoniaceae archaeon]|nr:mevalonate kinase [Candidatus Poseidoniaceae archaeon]
MLKVSAPGKCILLGEHAVVYGHPALAVSIDMRLNVNITKQKFESESHIIDGKIIKSQNHPHITTALNEIWGDDSQMLNINVSSEIPPSAGLGSSAALSVAIATGLKNAKNLEIDLEEISSIAHKLEANAQGGLASPMDTSTSTHGGCILLANQKLGGNWLYSRTLGEKKWEIHSFELHENMKDASLVIGHTGIHGSTADMVIGVKKRLDENPELKNDLDAINALTKLGVNAIENGDLEALGAVMNLNHSHLQNIGVSCNELDELVSVARETSLGAKLTGAGGGGCMIALTRNPTETARDIELAGGRSYICKFGVEGVKIEGKGLEF